MAERRMFAKQIIDSDAFLDMPLSAQSLYFHMAMRADDEGFVGNPRKIQKMIGASDDDFKLLLMKRYLLSFESGIIVIKHWKIHNYIQTDRFKPTTYIEEKSTLTLDEKKAYTECIQNGYKLDTQVSIGKVSIGKDSVELEKEINNNIISPSPKKEVVNNIHNEGTSKMIGCEGASAERMRRLRASQCDTLVLKSDVEIEKEIDINNNNIISPSPKTEVVNDYNKTPTYEEVKSYFDEHGLNDFEGFYKKNEMDGWKWKSGWRGWAVLWSNDHF